MLRSLVTPRRSVALIFALTQVPSVRAQGVAPAQSPNAVAPALRVIRAAPSGDANPLRANHSHVRPPRRWIARPRRRSEHRDARRTGDRRKARMARPGDDPPRSVDAASARAHVHCHVSQRRSVPWTAARSPSRTGSRFRARGPTLLGGHAHSRPTVGRVEQLAPNQHFELLYSAPVDLAKLSAAAYLEFKSACAGTRVIRARAVSQHPVAAPAVQR